MLNRGPGVNSLGGIAVLFLFGIIFLAIGLVGSSGKCTGTLCSVPPQVLGYAVGVPVTALAVAALATSIVNRHARYFITKYRLVETKRGKIVHQVSRTIFKGKPVSQFLEQEPAFKMPSRLGSSGQCPAITGLISVRVLDPESGRVLMNLKQVTADSMQTIQAIAGDTYCQYCGQKNSITNESCSQCGASL